MSLIIDGHNLIGVMPDIQLGARDDELRLLIALRAYRARAGGQPMIVFFDSGDLATGSGRAGRPGAPDVSTPGVQVRFSASSETADDAIVTYLQGRAQPGQYAVVTNDQNLAWRVRSAGASVIRASDFVARLAPPRPRPRQPVEPALDPHDPAFADIYRGFIEVEKARGQPRSRPDAEAAATWIEKLYGEDVEQAQQAARWLGQYGGPDALEVLQDALTHNDVRVRAAALLALGDLGVRAALPALADRLAHDAGSMAREAAAQSLGRIGNRSVEPALEAAARNDSKSKVRKAAQTALTEIRARRGN
jgi:predicted RNA-binding protein with PIN domain